MLATAGALCRGPWLRLRQYQNVLSSILLNADVASLQMRRLLGRRTPVRQVGLDERIQDAVRVAHLELGAMVFDEAVRV